MLGYNWKMAQLLAFIGMGMAKHHKVAIQAELGKLGPEDGYYPKTVYQHIWYQENSDRWKKLACPVAESAAKKVYLSP